MKLLGSEIKVVIFDMDGTLIDSVGIWAEIDKAFFAKRNMSVPEDYAKEIVHLGLKDGARMTVERYGFKETPEEIIQEWRDASIKEYSTNIQLKEGAKEFLEYLKDNNVICTIATANDEELYNPCLKRLGIEKYFSFIIDVNKVDEGKSSPKIFDVIVNKYGVRRDQVLVIEDSLTPLKTTFTNGFKVVAVYDDYSSNYDEEKKKYSHKFVYSMSELIEK